MLHADGGKTQARVEAVGRGLVEAGEGDGNASVHRVLEPYAESLGGSVPVGAHAQRPEGVAGEAPVVHADVGVDEAVAVEVAQADAPVDGAEEAQPLVGEKGVELGEVEAVELEGEDVTLVVAQAAAQAEALLAPPNLEIVDEQVLVLPKDNGPLDVPHAVGEDDDTGVDVDLGHVAAVVLEEAEAGGEGAAIAPLVPVGPGEVVVAAVPSDPHHVADIVNGADAGPGHLVGPADATHLLPSPGEGEPGGAEAEVPDGEGVGLRLQADFPGGVVVSPGKPRLPGDAQPRPGDPEEGTDVLQLGLEGDVHVLRQSRVAGELVGGEVVVEKMIPKVVVLAVVEESADGGVKKSGLHEEVAVFPQDEVLHPGGVEGEGAERVGVAEAVQANLPAAVVGGLAERAGEGHGEGLILAEEGGANPVPSLDIEESPDVGGREGVGEETVEGKPGPRAGVVDKGGKGETPVAVVEVEKDAAETAVEKGEAGNARLEVETGEGVAALALERAPEASPAEGGEAREKAAVDAAHVHAAGIAVSRGVGLVSETDAPQGAESAALGLDDEILEAALEVNGKAVGPDFVDGVGKVEVVGVYPGEVEPLELGGTGEAVVEGDVEVRLEYAGEAAGAEGAAETGGVAEGEVEPLAGEAVDGAGDDAASGDGVLHAEEPAVEVGEIVEVDGGVGEDITLAHLVDEVFPVFPVGHPVVAQGVEMDEALVGADVGGSNQHVVLADDDAPPHAVDAEAGLLAEAETAHLGGVGPAVKGDAGDVGVQAAAVHVRPVDAVLHRLILVLHVA